MPKQDYPEETIKQISDYMMIMKLKNQNGLKNIITKKEVMEKVEVIIIKKVRKNSCKEIILKSCLIMKED